MSLFCYTHESESEVSQSVRVFVTPWTAAYQAPPSMGFSRQEYWSGVIAFSDVCVCIYIYKISLAYNFSKPW